jgi:hypothetical protein
VHYLVPLPRVPVNSAQAHADLSNGRVCVAPTRWCCAGFQPTLTRTVRMAAKKKGKKKKAKKAKRAKK